MSVFLVGLFVIGVACLVEFALAVSKCIQIISRVGEK